MPNAQKFLVTVFLLCSLWPVAMTCRGEEKKRCCAHLRRKAASGPDSLEIELENLMDDQFERRPGSGPDSLEIELENLMDDQFERRPRRRIKACVGLPSASQNHN